MEKEDFINNILNSANGITKVMPNEIVFQKIEQRIVETNFFTKSMWLVAASITFLLTLNVVMLNQSSKNIDSEISSIENTINKNNQLYK